MKKAFVFLALLLSACTKNQDKVVPEVIDNPDLTVSVSQMLGDPAALNIENFDTVTDGVLSATGLSFGQVSPTNPSVSKITKVILVKNNSSSIKTFNSLTINESAPKSFSLKYNHCLNPLNPGQSCTIALVFSIRDLYNGVKTAQVVFNTSQGNISFPVSATIIDNPSPQAGDANLSVEIDSGFNQDSVSGEKVVRTIKVTNLSSDIVQTPITPVITSLDNRYTLRYNECSISLKPGASCLMSVWYNKPRELYQVSEGSLSITTSQVNSVIDLKFGSKGLRLSSPWNNKIITGTCSSAVKLRIFENSAPIVAAQDLVSTFSLSNGSVFSDSNCQNPISQITLSAGLSETSDFFIKINSEGSNNLVISSPQVNGVNQIIESKNSINLTVPTSVCVVAEDKYELKLAGGFPPYTITFPDLSTTALNGDKILFTNNKYFFEASSSIDLTRNSDLLVTDSSGNTSTVTVPVYQKMTLLDNNPKIGQKRTYQAQVDMHGCQAPLNSLLQSNTADFSTNNHVVGTTVSPTGLITVGSYENDNVNSRIDEYIKLGVSTNSHNTVVLHNNIYGGTWPFGIDGDLVVASGETKAIYWGEVKDFRNLTIEPNGTLILTYADFTHTISGYLPIIGVRGKFSNHGSIATSGAYHGAVSTNVQLPDNLNIFTWNVYQMQGGHGGTGGYVQTAFPPNNYPGSWYTPASGNGHGSGGSSGGNYDKYPLFGGIGGQPALYNNGAGGVPGGSWAIGQYWLYATAGSSLTGGSGGSAGAAGLNSFFASFSGAGGGGGVRGAHGMSVVFKVSGEMYGNGYINLSGYNGTPGGSGGNAPSSYAGNPNSYSGGGGGGGGGGAGGSCGQLTILATKPSTYTMNYLCSPGYGAGGGGGGQAYINLYNATNGFGGGAGSNGYSTNMQLIQISK